MSNTEMDVSIELSTDALYTLVALLSSTKLTAALDAFEEVYRDDAYPMIKCLLHTHRKLQEELTARAAAGRVSRFS